MGGIAGMISFSETLPDGIINQMVAALKHRGPGKEGYYCGTAVHFGTCMLEVGTQKQEQPISNEDSSLIAVVDGRIFNCIELKNNLLKKGHIFRTDYGQEIIVHLYEDYGTDFLNMIDGQFAFALYDLRKQEILLARDRVGICPLFYALKKDTIFFGSEIKAIIASGQIALKPSPDGLYENFVYWSTSGKRTVFENIYQIPPSCLGVIDRNGNVQIQRYHRFSDYQGLSIQGGADLKEEIFNTLVRSIEARIQGEAKGGVYYSGGLDSTILLRLLFRMGLTDLPVFSLGFYDSKIDESAFQALGYKEGSGEHYQVKVNAEDIINHLPQVLRHCEIPLYKLGPVPMYLLSQTAQETGVKFVLSGEGADELFYGYDIFKETLFRMNWSLNPSWQPQAQDLEPIVPSAQRGNIYLSEAYKNYFSSYLDQSDDLLYSMRPRIDASASLLKYFLPEHRKLISQHYIDEQVAKQFLTDPGDSLKLCQEVQMQILLAGYLLSSQGDRMLQANSIEGRFPFLDRRLISLAYSIPDSLKLHGYKEKHILKETFSEIVPEAILKRIKYQFATPGAELILSSRDRFEPYLDKRAIDNYGIFDYKAVMSLLQALQDASSRANFPVTENMILIYVVTTHMLLEQLNTIPSDHA